MQFFIENVVYHGLEGCWQVYEAKEQNHGFEQPFTDFKGSFPFISFFGVNIVIPLLHIELEEYLFPNQIMNKFGDEW